MQRTAAATAAWLIATHVIDHHEPFYAPIAAVIALNALGERGLNALRLLAGRRGNSSGGGRDACARQWLRNAGAGDLRGDAARALGGARITMAHSASSAILTVAVANGEAGTDRLEGALIGAGVALEFSQPLFSPEPVALLRRRGGGALADMAAGLELTALSLQRDHAELADRALSRSGPGQRSRGQRSALRNPHAP